jgi:DNA helicase-2/ATP-dependent DNA helicase PcrA
VPPPHIFDGVNTNRLLQDLNKDQLEAVTTTAGPLLVIAGAGSGKTRVLTRRLAYIITERLAEPYQVLAVTFTNKAAGEMKERVTELLGGQMPGLNVSTFHSFCARLLRREAEQLGYGPSFTIFDENDSETLMKNCIKDLSLQSSQFTPKAQRRKISDAKNRLVGAESFAASASGYFETTTAQLYLLYQQRLRECNAMDFDDLLFNAVVLMRDYSDMGDRYRRRFQYLMVDEYQDTNHAQYILLKYLLGEHKNIAVVGDEDQSIYGWRGADIRNILEFEKDFPGAKIIKLEQNYRSTNVILKAASAVIRNNLARKGKTLWTEFAGGEKLRLLLVDSAEAEAVRVADCIEAGRGETPLREMVILYRTNAQSRAFEEQLRRRNLPYQIVGGISFYQRKEIKDLMAYLKLIVNSRDDVSFERVINYPRRGIGEKTIADIATIAHRERLSSYDVAKAADSYPELAGRAARIRSFAELIEKYRGLKDSKPVDLLTQDLVDDLALIEDLRKEDAIIGQTKIENVESFIEGAAAFVRGNGEVLLENYLDTVSLFTDVDAYSEIEDKVALMTIHTAKGLEYMTVFLVGLEEGLFPLGRTIDQPMQLEEERRLFYVGATRAKRHVVLSSATTRYRFGEVMSVPSRFIKEIPEELIEPLDYRTGRYYDTAGAKAPTSFFGQAGKAGPETTGVHYEYEADELMRAGRIVQHPTFGRGKIVQTEGYGESLRLDIMFSGVGLKKVMAKYAKLKIIG